MAEQTRQATRDARQDEQRQRRGGTEGGEAARALDVNLKEGGTPGITSPSGDVHVEPPARAVPRTDMNAIEHEAASLRLAGGKTVEDLRGYLGDLAFPAKKDTIVRAARRNGAPEDVIGALNLLTATEYRAFEALLADYPLLPDRDDVEPNKGTTASR